MAAVRATENAPASRPVWPQVVELDDITIAPLSAGNSKRRLLLQADPPSPALQHFRAGRDVGAVAIEQLPVGTPASRVIEEPAIYAGLLFRHFGHVVAESIHRLWPRLAFEELRRAKIVFSPINNAKVMPYFRQALALHGIPKIDVIRIEEPTRFKRLIVGKQARQMAGPTIIAGYRTMLDGELTKRLGPPGGDRRLYLSRRRHSHTGSFYGESYVEEILASQNFEIVYPEEHSITDLVAMLRASSVAVFAEGSAIHALELCGSAVPDTFVIGRRSGSLKRFTPLLADICERWMISDRLLLNCGMSQNPKKHSGILDLAAMMADLQSFIGFPSGKITRAAIAASLRSDIEDHIRDPRNKRDGDHDLQANELRRLAEAAVPGN